jgi:dGTPase
MPQNQLTSFITTVSGFAGGMTRAYYSIGVDRRSISNKNLKPGTDRTKNFFGIFVHHLNPMQKAQFIKEAAQPENPKWAASIERFGSLYSKTDDIRSEFNRDYNRILHCKAYRRLKHKTQVFYATTNDHICTRIEHVNHVASVSYSIANYLGLNTELTGAIALGHDLGHAPFGHVGENILKGLLKKEGIDTFWHERNSLHFVDHLETLANLEGKETNLCLTYAVRDGIISHCGEVNENAIFPRQEAIDLYDIERPNQYPPFTWEGCVVKIADKISYLGRDIEDALSLGILSRQQLDELAELVEGIKKVEVHQISNTLLMNDFIGNLCEMSSPEKGIQFSHQYLELINKVKDFNYKNIYNHPRLKHYQAYAQLVMESLFNQLIQMYQPADSLKKELAEKEKIYPSLVGSFAYWLMKYADLDPAARANTKFGNHLVYKIENRPEYVKSVVDYLSSMTDHFAIKLFSELIRF